jgi:starch synthase
MSSWQFNHSCCIVTVSHGYASECQTREGGWGLDAVVQDHNCKLRGIVNGIDDTESNPELDPCLESDGYHNLFS